MQKNLEGTAGVMKKFNEKTVVIQCLCQDGLRDRHVKRINTVFQYTTGNLLDEPWSLVSGLGGEKLKADLETIADDAQKEFNIEKTLTSMKNDWKKLAFTCKSHKASGLILEGTAIEEI